MYVFYAVYTSLLRRMILSCILPYILSLYTSHIQQLYMFRDSSPASFSKKWKSNYEKIKPNYSGQLKSSLPSSVMSALALDTNGPTSLWCILALSFRSAPAQKKTGYQAEGCGKQQGYSFLDPAYIEYNKTNTRETDCQTVTHLVQSKVVGSGRDWSQQKNTGREDPSTLLSWARAKFHLPHLPDLSYHGFVRGDWCMWWSICSNTGCCWSEFMSAVINAPSY